MNKIFLSFYQNFFVYFFSKKVLSIIFFIIIFSCYYLCRRKKVDVEESRNEKVGKIFNKNLYRFIHIPKTGGTAFCKAVSDVKLSFCCDEKMGFCSSGAHSKIKNMEDKHIKFIVIVRDPYTRFQSAFKHSKYLDKTSRYGANKNDQKFQMKLSKYSDVNKFIQGIKNNEKNAMYVFNKAIHFKTQFEFVTEDPLLGIDSRIKHILYQENLQRDMNLMFDKIGMKRIELPKDDFEANKSKQNKKVKFTRESLDFINDFYHFDFHLFGYNKK